MEKLVVFPLNNDTEILIKGLKENKLYQVVAVSSYIEDRSRLELLQKKSSIYCSNLRNTVISIKKLVLL